MQPLLFPIEDCYISFWKATGNVGHDFKREALLEAGIMVPESLFASYTGRSDRAMIYEVAARHGLGEQRSAEILDRKHRIYESLSHTLPPVPGAIEFVHWAALAIDLPWLHPQHRAIDRQH